MNTRALNIGSLIEITKIMRSFPTKNLLSNTSRSRKMMLKNKVKDGTDCIFTKCPQVRCNVIVPHSFFLKYLKNGPDEDDGQNYLEKYNPKR